MEKHESEPRSQTPAQGGAIGCGVLEVPAVQAVVWLAWTGRGLSHLLWAEPGAGRPRELEAEIPEQTVPAAYSELLEDYFAGKPVEPVSLPVDLVGTPFQVQVWNALRRVPRGSVRSYAGIANDVGSPRAMRAVGMANSKNPVAVVVPCHRIIDKDHGLGGYSAGLRIKRYLLALEGVDVAADHVRAGQLALI